MGLRTQTPIAGLASGALLAILLSLTGCHGDDEEEVAVEPPPAAGTTSLRLAMTDAPQCGYDHVYVTVSAIKVNQSGAAGDSDAGWYTITLPTLPKRIDLLGLSNGL